MSYSSGFLLTDGFEKSDEELKKSSLPESYVFEEEKLSILDLLDTKNLRECPPANGQISLLRKPGLLM